MPRNALGIVLAFVGALTIAAIFVLAFVATARADESDDHPAVFFARDAARMRGDHFGERTTMDGVTVRASWYGGGERLNRHTASGERFNPHGMTAAHRTLPLGTRLRVCLAACIVVRVNDRGPAAWTGKSLDLSRRAAIALGFYRAGSARVQISVM